MNKIEIIQELGQVIEELQNLVSNCEISNKGNFEYRIEKLFNILNELKKDIRNGH